MKNKNSKSNAIHELNHPEFEKLVGDVVHKMKNNLGGLSGFATLLERDLGEDSQHLGLIEQIQSSVMRLDRLIVDLMVFIRKPGISKENVHLRPMINNLIASYEGRNQLKCEVEYDSIENDDKLAFYTDAFIIERVFIYIVRFIEQAGAILRKMIIMHDVKNIMHVNVLIDQFDFESDEKDTIINIQSEYEPVEARLAFAILLKFISTLNGYIEVSHETADSIILKIEISLRKMQ